MALQIKKDIILSGTSTITEDGGIEKTVAVFSARLSTDNTQANQYPVMSKRDNQLYEENKSIVRADKEAFDEAFYQLEDETSSPIE